MCITAPSILNYISGSILYQKHTETKTCFVPREADEVHNHLDQSGVGVMKDWGKPITLQHLLRIM